jgi:hypothetical protein
LETGRLLDHNAFERLKALFVAFLDLYMDANSVAGLELGQVCAPRLCDELFDDLRIGHDCYSFISDAAYAVCASPSASENPNCRSGT